MAILWVLLARILLRHLPRGFSYGLWLIVFVRLICPFSLEGNYGLMPLNMGQSEEESRIVTYPYENYYRDFKRRVSDGFNEERKERIEGAIPLGEFQNDEQSMEGINKKEENLTGGGVADIVVELVGIVWLVGVLVLVFRDVRHYYKLSQSLKESLCIEGNLYRYKGEASFVFGILQPKIFLPWHLELDEAAYIIQHEQVHIKRKDYLLKIIAAIIVNIHWFNPLVWLAFSKMSEDMELSCDEKVIKTGEKGSKKAYAQLLLKHGIEMEFKQVLMFGKHPIEKRVAHVLSYEKTKRWKYLIAGILVVLVGLGVMVESVSRRATAIQGEMHTKIEPAIEKAISKGTQIDIQAASVVADAPIGVQGVSLDYASETYVIFHDYFGLFVYDLKEKNIITSLNLETIGCQWMQGDNACDVIVNKEGNIILLHPMMSEEMFVYDLKEQTLIQTQFATFEEPFKPQENPNPSGAVSYQVVMLPDGKMGYMGYANGMVKDITYYVGDQEAYPVFKDFFEEKNVNTGSSEGNTNTKDSGSEINKEELEAGQALGVEGVQEDEVFLVEEGESGEVIARILKVDLENKSLVVEGLSENSPLGTLCIVSCEPSFVYKQQPDLSQEEYAFEALKEGDIVRLLIDGVAETVPAQTYAGEITWLGSKKDAELAVNYSIAYIPQSGNPMFLENIGEAQKAHIERLITQYVSTSFALSGRGIDEIGDYYLIQCESEREKEAYLIYQIGGEAYIQQSTYGDINQIGQCQKINWVDYEEITRWH